MGSIWERMVGFKYSKKEEKKYGGDYIEYVGKYVEVQDNSGEKFVGKLKEITNSKYVLCPVLTEVPNRFGKLEKKLTNSTLTRLISTVSGMIDTKRKYIILANNISTTRGKK